MSECIFIFGNFGRSFISLAMYKSASSKRIAMSGSVFRALSKFGNASTDAVHMPRLTLWVNWYICCIVSVAKPYWGQRFVVVCPCCYRIIIVGKLLLVHFVMKCAIYTAVVSCDILNDVRSIPSKYSM